MTLASPADVPLPPHRSLVQRAPDIVVWGAVIVLLIVAFRPVEMNHLPRLSTNSENMRQFGQEFLHPDFTNLRTYIAQMWLTIQIAMWGTTLAVVIAIPFGLACARNVSPAWLQQPMRLLMNLLRSIPDPHQRQAALAHAMSECVRLKPETHSHHGNQQMSRIGG